MVREKLNSVQERIKKAALRAGRSAQDVILVCAVKEAHLKGVEEAVASGVTDIGENRVQDAVAKYELLNKKARLRWHFIGHLQTNKVKKALKLFDLIHSVDSIRLAREIQKQAEKINKMQSILVQVNVAGEEAKFGIGSKGAEDLVKKIRDMKNLMLLGLMTMTPYTDNSENSRVHFKRLRKLRDIFSSYNCDNIDMKHLSMGMSGDFEVAIEEGADMVRIGSAIFN